MYIDLRHCRIRENVYRFTTLPNKGQNVYRFTTLPNKGEWIYDMPNKGECISIYDIAE